MSLSVATDASTRPNFPGDEARQPWLSVLPEHIIDAGVTEAIRREQAQGRTPAYGKDCAAIAQGRLHTLARVMRYCQWDTIVRRMDAYDAAQEIENL